MAIELKIELDEATKAQLEAFLSDLAAKAANTSGALKGIGEALLQTTYERFEQGKDPQGNAWRPLTPLTVKLRGSASPILLRSGRLRASINYNVEGSILKLGPNTVDAAAHQFGATIVPKEKKALRMPGGAGGQAAIFTKKVTIPARPYIGIGRADMEAMEDALLDWLDAEGEAKNSMT